MNRPHATSRRARSAARALGWFSVGLGLAELLLPRQLAAATGMRARRSSVQLCGARELATGVAILCARDPTPWVWGRVAGDVIDLSLLGANLSPGNPRRERATAALAAVAGVTAVDVICARRLTDGIAEHRSPVYDYSQRSGFPRPPAEMRGLARTDFHPDRDMRTPVGLRPISAQPS